MTDHDDLPGGSAEAGAAPDKYLSVRQAAFIGVGAMVGAGIFALLGAAGAVAGAAVWLSFLIAGAIAKLLMPGRDPAGCIITIVIGIVGDLLGGWLATKLGWGGAVSGLNIPSLITAVLGSILLLIIWRLIRGRR